jgi:DNA gyrase subunit A
MFASSGDMAIHFRTSHDQLRLVVRDTRGVRSMSLKKGDELMDILPSQVVNAMVAEIEVVKCPLLLIQLKLSSK